MSIFTIFAICLAIIAFLMVKIARHPLPRTWTTFVILSVILSTIIGYWPPHIASPWPMVALVIWLVTGLVVFEAREIRSRRAIGTMIIMTIVLIGIAMFAPKIVGFPLQDKPSPSTPAITTSTHTTWKMESSDYGNNRWFANGLAEIKDSKTNAEAASAANAWLEKVKTDPNLLAGAVKYLLARDTDKTTLVDKDGWATDKAAQLVSELELTLGQSKVIAADAPSTGYNSGVENNTVVGSAAAGINGDRKAVQVTLPDGEVIWIMGRCGNIVTKGSPPVPPGKTDQPPIKPVTPAPKDPSKDVGANPLVAPYKKDATGGDTSKGHQVSNENGATVSNGVQADPAADAAAAEAIAKKEAAAKAAAQANAIAIAKAAAIATAKKTGTPVQDIVVDKNQNHTVATPPPSDW